MRNPAMANATAALRNHSFEDEREARIAANRQRMGVFC
jgi:hypothetical protein